MCAGDPVGPIGGDPGRLRPWTRARRTGFRAVAADRDDRTRAVALRRAVRPAGPRGRPRWPTCPRFAATASIRPGAAVTSACRPAPTTRWSPSTPSARWRGSGAAWRRPGGRSPGSTPRRDGATGRNLMGFKDGTNNLDAADVAAMRRNVWVGQRRRAGVDARRHVSRDPPHPDPRRALGRQRPGRAGDGRRPAQGVGRPVRRQLGVRAGRARRWSRRTATSCSPTRARRAARHERILRRGYSFDDGLLPDGRLDAGLFFAAFQRDPRRQFVPIQRRLAAHDLLGEYLVAHRQRALRRPARLPSRRVRRRHAALAIPSPVSLVADLERALGTDAVISEPAELRMYECDGLTGHRAVPLAVVLPRTTEEVQAAVRVCRTHGAPFVARGAGTGLSGGAVPVAEGIVIGLARMNRDPRGRCPQPAGARPARRDEPRRDASGCGPRPLLRPRPVEPAGVHDRRQRRRELRRRPLPEVRLHVDARPRAARRPGRRRGAPARSRRAARPRRRLRRVGGDARDRDRDHGAGRAAPPAGRDAPGRVPVDGRCRRGRVGHHRRRHRPGGGRDDGRAHDPGRRGRGSCRASARCGRRPARRARRAGGGGRADVPARGGAVRGGRRRRGARRGRRCRAGHALVRPQGGVRGDGPGQPRLLRPGRRRPAHAPPADAAADRGALGPLRAPRRKRVPRRRRQPAPARALRLRGRGRGRAGRAAGRRDPRRLRRGGRVADR